MKVGNLFPALFAHAHLHPRSPVVLAPAPAVQAVEAALTEEVLALVAEEHGGLLHVLLLALTALYADLQLPDVLRFPLPGQLELADEITVALHEIVEIGHVFHLP